MPHELPLPPAAIGDKNSLEMIRVWLADDKQHSVLNIGFWEDRGIDERKAWGILLADMIHHVANAHEEQYGRSADESIERIKESFLHEIQNPSSPRRGKFVIKKDKKKKK